MIHGGGQTSVTIDKTLIKSCQNTCKKQADYLEKNSNQKGEFKEREKKESHSYAFFLKLLEISHTSTCTPKQFY